MIIPEYTNRDFRQGRFAKSAVSESLVPENSVANSLNVNFDEIIGKAKVRAGTTLLGLAPITGIYNTQDSFYTGNDNYEDTSDGGGAKRIAQVFTANTTFIIVGVKLKLFKSNSPTTTFRVRISPASGGKPVYGSILSQSNVINPANLASSATDYFIPVGQIQLTGGVQYSIVIDYQAVDATNKVAWAYKTAGGYSGGTGSISTDSGSTWTNQTFDFMFETYSLTEAISQTPLGLNEFVIFSTTASTLSQLVAVLKITPPASSQLISSGAGIFYYQSSTGNWLVGYTGISNSVRTRFAVLGSRLFFTNENDGMKELTDASNAPVTTNSISSSDAKPSLLINAQNRLLASGDPTYPSRVWFSSIISPASSPFITWNMNTTTGDWIDFNPDDGGSVVGMINIPNGTLIFKTNGFYRLDAINKTASVNAISPIGARTQEGITNCQGVAYFFSGSGIWRTAGDVPELVSRLGVQDFIDAIPQANWNNVVLGSDDFNVYASIGDITLGTNTNDERIYNNVVLKFSIRDQTWSVHSYGDEFKFFGNYTTSSGRILVELDSNGNGQQVNSGMTDNGDAINYEVETQDLEFGDRSHLKVISDKIVSFNSYGQDGQLQIRGDSGNYQDIRLNLTNRTNIGKNINIQGHFFNLRWMGQTKGKSPIWEGYSIPKITDKGVINTDVSK